MLDQLTNQNNEEEVHPSAEIHVLLYLKSRWVFQLVSWKRSLKFYLIFIFKDRPDATESFYAPGVFYRMKTANAAQLHKEELRIYFTLFSKVSRK